MEPTGKANGRGAYICSNAECFRKAVRNKGLERSLKSSIPADVLERIEKELG
nr:YlxR family protein [Butyrivibrio sp. FCS014]